MARARITNRMRLTRTLHGTGFETKSVAPAAYPLPTDAESSAPGNHDHRHVTSLGGVAEFSADFGGPSSGVRWRVAGQEPEQACIELSLEIRGHSG